MLKYGMFVKTIKPVDIFVAPCFQKLINELKPFYKIKAAVGMAKDFRNRSYVKITLPENTLGIFTYGFVGRDREEFKIVFPNPATNRITKCMSALVDAESFTNDLTKEQKDYLIPIFTHYFSTRHRLDNLKVVETVSNIIDFNMKEEE